MERVVELIFYPALAVLIMLGLPIMVYVCVKMGTAAYYKAREQYKRDE